MKSDELDKTLSELIQLTRRRRHFVEFLQELRTACSDRPEQLQSIVSDLRLWGGMGSVADEAGLDLSPAQKRRTYVLLIRLYELLESKGITDQRGAAWVSAFRQCTRPRSWGTKSV